MLPVRRTVQVLTAEPTALVELSADNWTPSYCVSWIVQRVIAGDTVCPLAVEATYTP